MRISWKLSLRRAGGGSRVEAGLPGNMPAPTTATVFIHTFTLRDMKWSDGQKVTAADFCLRLAAAGGPGHGLPPMRRCWRWWRGYRQVRSSGDVSKLQVSAPEENTFVVTLSNRCAYFLSAVLRRRPPCRYAQHRRTGRRIPRPCVPTGLPHQRMEERSADRHGTESYYDQRRLQMSTLVFRFETDAAMRTEALKKERGGFRTGTVPRGAGG